MTPTEVVLAFFKAWETGFVPAFETWLAEDAVWQNTGFPDRAGRAAYMSHLDEYLRVVGLEFGRAEIVSIAEVGDTVLTERVDHLWAEGDTAPRHSARIMGALQVRDGKIVRYSDYFDASQFNAAEFAN